MEFFTQRLQDEKSNEILVQNTVFVQEMERLFNEGKWFRNSGACGPQANLPQTNAWRGRVYLHHS